MKNSNDMRKWLIVVLMIIIILLHQLDNGLMQHILPEVQNVFCASWVQAKTVIVLGVLVAVIGLPLWGYVSDRYSRRILLGLSGLLWGLTSWLMGISPTLGTFTISYAMGMMDNASYPMVFSLLSDYFRPHDRGKIFGVVHSARPLAFLLGLFILQDLTAKVNWRVLLVSTGVIGLILGLLAILIIRDPKRGQSEPAFKSIQISGHYVFDMDLAKQTMIKPGLLLLLVFGFAATVTWNILTSGIVTYLEIYTEMSQPGIITTMVPLLLAMTIGSIMGGLVGDLASRTRKNGRILVCLLSNAFTLIAFVIALQVSPSGGGTFVAMLSAAGIFVATVYPNLAAMVVEVTLPELRSTTIAALMASQLAGSLFSPLAVEALSSQVGFQMALSRLAVSALGLGLAVLMALLFFLPGEIDHVREHLAFRGKLESRLETHK